MRLPSRRRLVGAAVAVRLVPRSTAGVRPTIAALRLRTVLPHKSHSGGRAAVPPSHWDKSEKRGVSVDDGSMSGEVVQTPSDQESKAVV